MGHAAAAGGDADPLALLLGGENGIGAAAFPATLQAALAEGAATGEAGDEGVDVTDLLADGADGEGEDGVTSLDAALAAALALGAAVVTTPPTAVTTPGASGDTAIEGAAVAASAIATTSVGAAETAAAIAGEALSTVTAGTETATAVAAPVVDPAATAPATSEPTAALADPAPHAKTETSTETGTAAGRTATTAVAVEAAVTRPPAMAAHVDTGTTRLEHHATSAVDGTDAATPFSSAGSDEHGLDLGTPEREHAGLVVQKSLHAASPTAPALAPTDPIVQAPAGPITTTASSDAPAAVPPQSPPLTPHEPATARTASAAHHPGAIEARWSERVTDALRLSGVRGGSEIRLQLEPEGLGHIDVRLHMHADGVRAVIVAEHESTRALLTSQQHLLQDAFDRSDLRLTGFSVDVGSGGGAATFGHEQEGGMNGGASTGATAPAPANVANQDNDTSSAPLANGRVNVRV